MSQEMDGPVITCSRRVFLEVTYVTFCDCTECAFFPQELVWNHYSFSAQKASDILHSVTKNGGHSEPTALITSPPLAVGRGVLKQGRKLLTPDPVMTEPDFQAYL